MKRTHLRASKRGGRPPARRAWHHAIIADYAALMAKPGVRRVGLGWKERRGRLTRRMSVKLYVSQKIQAPAPHELLPKSTTVLIPMGRGRYRSVRVPTDVVIHASARLCATPQDFLNPVAGGAELAVAGAESGTFACVVVNGRGERYGLTAGHIVQHTTGPVATGLSVTQPETAPNNLPSGVSIVLGDTAGGFLGNTKSGYADYVLIKVRNSRRAVSTSIDGAPGNGSILPWSSVINSQIDVTKYGAVTKRTNGRFSTRIPLLEADGISASEVYEFIGTGPEPFGARGDSGALVVSLSSESRGRVVGLLFATHGPTDGTPGGRGYVFPFERITGFRPF